MNEKDYSSIINIKTMICSYRNLIFSIAKRFTLTIFLISGILASTNAQECVSDPSLLVKWDFTKAQECNGITVTKRKFWKPDVPLMTGGNQYCPQINDGSGQAMIYEQGFGNTNDFKGVMCIAGFWKNSGNKYFRAPGYDPASTTYDPDNLSGNIWIDYQFLPGQAGSLSSFNYDFIQTGYKAGGTVAFDNWGIVVNRNGVRVFEQTLPIAAINVNNPDEPLTVTFPNTSEFRTDGSTEVIWQIGFAFVKRNKSARSGIDNLCIFGTAGQAAADVQATPATCESGGVDGQLEVVGFSAGEKYDFNLGSSYTGTATYATATDIPANGIIANNLPLGTMAEDYSVRIFRQDCYIDALVVMPPVFCPYTCDFPTATVTPNAATCVNEILQDDATIVITDIVNMDKVGISAGQSYTGPAYAGATDLGGASSYTFDNTDGVSAGTCTEYYTLRFFNGAEDEERCIADRVVAISAVSCDGCQVICAVLEGTDSEETDSSNNLGQAEACKTDEKVDLKIAKTVDQNSGTNCNMDGTGTEFVFTVTLENIGDLAAENVTITDVFPDEMVIASITTTAGIALESFGTIDWVLPTFAANALEEMTVTASFIVPGTYQNCVEVKTVFPVNDPDNSNDTDCAEVTITGTNLPSIEKAFSPEYARANVPIRLILKLFNNESGPIALIQDLVDDLPSTPGQMLIASTPNLATELPGIVADPGTSQLIVPSGTVLLPGLNTITVDVIAPVNGDYTNTIEAGDLVTTACSNPAQAFAEVNMSDDNVIAPLITKSFSNDMLSLGQNSTLTITIENRNPEDVTLLADFVDEMPSGLTVTGTPTSSCGGATTFGEMDRVGLSTGTVISGNSVCTIEVEVEATEAGSQCNRIIFNAVIVEVDLSGGGVPTSNEDVAEACIEVVSTPVFDLALRKTLSTEQLDTITINDTINYDITIYNQGTEEALEVQITDYISSDMVFIEDDNWELFGGNAILKDPIPSILPGASVTIPIQFKINPTFTGESIVNFAEISSVANMTPDKDSSPDDNPTNDKGGLVQSTSDDVIFGDATLPGGSPLDENGLTDEDDADPAIVFLRPLVCVITIDDLSITNCDPNTQTYDLEVTVSYIDLSGTDLDINGTTFTTDGSGTETFTLTGLAADGSTGLNVTVADVGNVACEDQETYNAPSQCLQPPDPCETGEMGGSVFYDTNANGQDDDSSGTLGFGGIRVQIFGCTAEGSSELIETVFTDVNGDYHFTDATLVDGEEYRIEFSSLPDGFTSSVIGADSKTATQVVNSITCDVDLGILVPGECIDQPDGNATSNDIRVVTTCFVNGDLTENDPNELNDVLVALDYDYGGVSGNQYLATKAEMGSIWAVAFNQSKDVIYTASILKRHTGMGPDGPGAIYQHDISSGTNSLFVDLVDLGINVGTMPTNRGLGEPNQPSYDNNAFPLIGKMSLGDMDIDDRNQRLYVMNLHEKSVHVINIDTKALITSYPITGPGCTSGEWRPFAVKYYQGHLYVGGVCDASSGGTLDDLTGYVYRLDGNTFTEVISIPLDYDKGAPNLGGTVLSWQPWVNAFNEFLFASPITITHPQPILSDIEFDDTGSMIIGFADRSGFQLGFQNYLEDGNNSLYNNIATGDILRANLEDNGDYVLEDNGTSGAYTTTGQNNNEGPGGGEFFIGDVFRNFNEPGGGDNPHRETGLGGLAILEGSGQIIMSAFDPRDNNNSEFNSGGLVHLSATTGLKLNSFSKRIYNTGVVGAFGKSAGIGDVEIVCDPAPIQVGNYVWIDTNGDGIQDPCEEPLSGLTVKLYTKPTTGNAELVATTMTNEGGEYYFTNNTNSSEMWNSPFVEVEKDSSYYIVFCGDSYDSVTNVINFDGGLFELTDENTGMGMNPDFNDSDAEETSITGLGDLPAICITADSIDHSYDVGLLPKPDVALTLVVDPSYDASTLSYGDSVKFKVVVYNQSLTNIDSVDVVNYMPSGYSFDANLTGNQDWSITDTVISTTLNTVIQPGEADSTCFYLTLLPSDQPENWVTVAEVSAAYQNGAEIEDCDSPLNDDPTDNVGSEINTPADDEIEGNGTATEEDGVAETDQDNVDPAQISVCDLALINVIDEISDTLEIGDTVKYAVIIENQGNIDATNIDIRYTIPVGLTYLEVNDGADPMWEDDATGANTTISEVLEAGDLDTICIYLAIDNVSLMEASLDAYTTLAEISAFEDPAESGVDKNDIDSNPNSDPEDDPGGNPDDDTDDETDGNGTGDPDNENEDSDPLLDEDDHDPAIVYICDAAITIYRVDSIPVEYGDTVKFNIVVYNQGNDSITQIMVQDTLGEGLDFITTTINTNEGWSGNNENITAVLTDTIVPGETDTICLELQVIQVPNVNLGSYVQYTEIMSFELPEELNVSKGDIDSTPDDDPNNDPGGNPNDETDDEIDGDGSGDPNDPNEDSDPLLDEDDHDPVLVDIFDLALDKTVNGTELLFAPGDTVTFDIRVHNQGNVAAANFTVTDYLNSGFEFLPGLINAGWDLEGDDYAFDYTNSLAPDSTALIQLSLRVIVPAMPTGVSDWYNYAEISAADDNNDINDESPVDADSYLDAIDTNDNVVIPGDDNDNEIDENGKLGEDEDDHDVAHVTVGFDLALNKTVEEGPYAYGDTLEYTITVYNQGGLSVTDVAVYDTIPCGLIFDASLNPDWDYSNNVARDTINGLLATGEEASTTISLIVGQCETPAYSNYYNVAEISGFLDEDGMEPNSEDIDSTPDDDPNNDENPVDDEIDNGDEDEDDHDFEDIEICDLALINRIVDAPESPKVGDTLKYEIIVYNQGNGDANTVDVDYTIPIGLTYLPLNDDLDPVWDLENPMLSSVQFGDSIVPGASDTVCLYLQLENLTTSEASEDAYTTIAEITSFTNDDDETKTTDADSKPDDNPNNDPGGNPDDDTDDVVDGNGEGDSDDPMEDSDPNLDEDDHDPAIIYICDAAVVINTEDEGTFEYGDTVKFTVEIHNQGNGDLSNINIQNIFGNGLVFVENQANEDEGWTEVSEGDLELIYEDTLNPAEIDTICLYMEINDDFESTEDSWLQNVEIVSFEDPDAPGISKEDIDSTPDDITDNDPGGNPDDDTDDETDGDGSGDPDDPMEDEDPNLDEDDQDTEDLKIFDLALYMQIDSMPPVVPVVPGDVMKFIVVVDNQGNIASTNTDVVNYIMPDNLVLSDMSTGWLSPSDSMSTYTFTDPILPGDIDTVCIYLEVVDGAMADIVTWSEISGSDETDGVCYDIDSDPDSILTNDPGGNPNDQTDDEIQGNGEGDSNDPIEDSDPTLDEDDHDPAILPVQDLALLIWTTEKNPVQENQDVKFEIRVINQGAQVNENVVIANYIPEGFELSPTDTYNWTNDSLNVYTSTLEGRLMPHDTLETCIVLRVNEDASAEDLITYSEIVSSTDTLGVSLNGNDVDSYPDANANNDTGGVPADPNDCATTPDVIGDDNNTADSGVAGEDEDDHDPAWVHVLDLATIIYPTTTLPIIPGDEIKFNVDVHNQGNVSAQNIGLIIEMPDGFTLSPNDTNGWDTSNNGQLDNSIEDALNPTDSTTVCIILQVLPDFAIENLIPIVEITTVQDTFNNNITEFDIDSDPNTNVEDDEGGEPLTADDDRLDGNGESDNDEDDHDPAVPPILDLAINIITVDESPKKPGDVVKFKITVYNQGSLTPESFNITNYIPDGLEYANVSGNIGWSLDNDVPSYEYTDALLPFQSDSLCIYLRLKDNANPSNVVNMVEISQIIDDENRDVSLLDIDSESDDSNDNDKGNDIYSLEDNKLLENGRSGFDEDDHDQAFVNMCEAMACKSAINVSLNELCIAGLTADMLVIDNDYPEFLFEITAVDENGIAVDPQNFTGADVGKTFTVSVINLLCNENFCQVEVTIEDKFPPQIMCVNDTITCGELIVFPDPIVTENCTDYTLTLLNETFESVDCNDPELQQIITREWIATDAAGNQSNTCMQTLSISKFDIGTVTPPVNSEIPLACGVDFPIDANGGPDPVVYGSPQLSGENLWPAQFLICNLMVNYSDQTIPTAQNEISIVRTWTATTWYCGQDSTRQFVQVFVIADTDGPIMDCPADMSFSTSGFDCTAEVVLPEIPVSDLCGAVIDVDVQYEGGFIENSNGGSASLPMGTSTVTYIASDDNGNTNSCSFNVTVADNSQPITVCEQFTTISLTNDGTAVVTAEAFDDGSFDACGPVTLELRRMTPSCDPNDAVFGETITFCCEDIGVEQMVVLRATDQAGNFNECMVSATIDDKIPPILVQGLPDITLSCEFPFNTQDTEQFGSIVMNEDDIEAILLTADLVEFSGPATDGLVVGNCVELVSDEFTFSNINSCGIGTATRILTFANAQGLSVTDIQQITFENPSPFTINDIDFPNDISFQNICDLSAVMPENLPAGFDIPTYTEDACDQIGYDYEDSVTDLSNGSMSCYQIIRTWTLADWCQNVGGVFATFEGQQIITVTNTIAPEITGDCTDREQCSYDVECGPMYIELINSGTDDCTQESFLNWTYMIDLNSDGTIDEIGNTEDASGTYPVGLHTINWILSDGCGNEDNCSYTFEIKNCKAATPICLDNLTAEITGMDLDGDNLPDTELVMITPSFFDGGSYHVCGTDIQLSFSMDVNDTLRVYGCDDIGEQAIQLWVTDVNGNQDYCSTSIDVQNNTDLGLCPETLTVDVEGDLYTELGEMIAKADVALEGGDLMDQTEEDGHYDFLDMPTGGDYVINPEKDIDHINGVSTLDIILVQKHILGLEILDSPYKMIAADVNHSDNITGQDIIQIRKLILGQNADFPNNTSWRFIDSDHIFLDQNNPWITEIPETYSIDDLSGDMLVNFTGVKIGDVNNSALPNNLIGEQIDTRSNDKLNMVTDARRLSKGQETWIPIYADDFDHINGFQLGATISNHVEILDIKSGSLEMVASNYVIDNDKNRFSMIWHEADPLTLDANRVLFEVLIQTNSEMSTEEIWTINDEVLRNEAYDAALQSSMIEWGIRTRENQEVADELSIEMEQNEPNPWINTTIIDVKSSIAETGTLRIMDMTGKILLTKIVELKEGENEILLTKEEVPSIGVLYYELKVADNALMKKMVLLK